MLFDIEYPQVYSHIKLPLPILYKPITWFRPYLSSIGQLILYRFKIKPFELETAEQLFEKNIIRMNDGSELMVALSKSQDTPKGVVVYLHTVCGNYTQLSHIAHMIKDDNLAYITYTRSGNDCSLNFNKFNFVGRIEELQLVITYIHTIYPNVPIHAIGASAGSALLIRYLGRYNEAKKIKSAILVSPGYNFLKSFKSMDKISQSYLVNKMKYTVRNLPNKHDLKTIKTLDNWIDFQSRLLGYSREDYIKECDPVNYLHLINVPTLCISSLDDNVFKGDITKEYINLPSINPNVSIVVTKRGGHVIFEDEGHDLPWFLRVSYEWLKHHIQF